MKVIITPKAQKHYGHLPKGIQVKIKKKLQILENDPLAGKKLSGELKELRSFRVWPYRVLYYVDNPRETIYIAAILHRQGAYK
ncbi:MAG: type II toxin-antitoxin system RelE/ParE family toxin [bacterium]|nr:type II toxin-antitoxin system RelE/ParE family toxin [bacterium]